MAPLKFADFKPQTKVSDSDYARLESEGGLRLTPGRRADIENALIRYELLRDLKEAGEGVALKEALITLEAGTEKFIESIQAVTNEPGHIWEYLLAESGAHVSNLPRLLNKCRELNRRVARRGPKADFFLGSLLSQLADIFEEATGKRATISHANGRGGRFLGFAFAATECLPKKFQPQSKDALGGRWDRERKARKKEKFRSLMWIGGPYPALAKLWFAKNKL
jgi:hypothetical protein